MTDDKQIVPAIRFNSAQSSPQFLNQRIKSLESTNTDLRNKNMVLQQRNNFLEEYIRQEKGTLRGVLEGHANMKAAACELIHPMYMAEISLDRLHKRLQGNRVKDYITVIALTIIAAILVAYVWTHPEVWLQIQMALNNWMVIAAALIFGIAAVFILVRWRARK